MFNAWDFVFALLLLLSAYLGWKLKSLPLLGLGFAIALAPLCATKFSPELGVLLVDKFGGEGLKPNQDRIAWWIIAIATSILLWLIFGGLSKMLAALKLEFLDRGFGALICALIFTACLSLNLTNLSKICSKPLQTSLSTCWAWNRIRSKAEPAWVRQLEDKMTSLNQLVPEAQKKTVKIKAKIPTRK